MSRLPRGLYAITPDWTDTRRLLDALAQALSNGTAVVQYRNKAADPALRLTQARALQTLCRQHGVPFIINDHLDLALQVGADGLHLGADDGHLAAARARLGGLPLLGASCYQSLPLAEAARSAGADYVAFGAAFPSRTKPQAASAPHALYTEARQTLGLPVVAIGGITPDNATLLTRAGIDHLAVIGALFEAQDIAGQSRAFACCFSPPAPPES